MYLLAFQVTLAVVDTDVRCCVPCNTFDVFQALLIPFAHSDTICPLDVDKGHPPFSLASTSLLRLVILTKFSPLSHVFLVLPRPLRNPAAGNRGRRNLVSPSRLPPPSPSAEKSELSKALWCKSGIGQNIDVMFRLLPGILRF